MIHTGSAGSNGLAGGWPDYLDAAERAALLLREQLLGGAVAELAELATLTPPPGPIPAALEARRQAVHALLADVEAQARRHRDDLRQRLDAAPRQPGRPASADQASWGGRLDVTG